MKKIISTAFLGLALFMVSCDTCTTCQYQTRDGEEMTEEFCGNKSETEEFKSEIENTAIENRSKYSCQQNH